MSENPFPGLTIRKLINNLFETDNLSDLLYWPPNLFALTSIILHRTGAYRICQVEEVEWNIIQRNTIIDRDGYHWIKEVGQLIREEDHKFNPFCTSEGVFQEAYDYINNRLDFPLSHLRIVVSDPISNFPNSYQITAEVARHMAKSLVDLHAVADLASATMGIVDDNYSEDHDINLALTLANLLLTTQGTLSTIDKLNGCVLPKYRTPQQGQSLRSLSHHITFHFTETEIVWRSIPWLDTNERSINILAIPFPFVTHTKDFNVVPSKNHHTRYFKIHIDEFSEERVAFIHSVVQKLIELKSRISRIHMVLLPELALTKEEYDYFLLLLFKKKKEIDYLPIVIAGVLSDDFSTKEQPFGLYNNEVKIANYYAGRWYDINQRKHHRWKLDKNQLIQYQLATKMPTHRNWFEYISTSQRKLTVLSTNSWLSIIALICEDLARLEPVSEVIRGVGPTLLLALLSDGPQLSNRWPARYATVFADDPGTSVFSLTSLGMAKRSNMRFAEPFEQETKEKHVVGLWKDANNANREITVTNHKKGANKNALVMTLTAKFCEEHTLDGRTDECMASELELDTYFPVTLHNQNFTDIKDCHSQLLKQLTPFSSKLGNWSDIRGITVLYYFLDDIVCNQDKNLEILEKWLLVKWNNHSNITYKKLYHLVSIAFTDPLNVGLSVRMVEEWPSQELISAINTSKTIIHNTCSTHESSQSKLNYYEILFEETKKVFNDILQQYQINFTAPPPPYQEAKQLNNTSPNLPECRSQLAVCITVGILINSKINDENLKGNLEAEAKCDGFSDRVINLRNSINEFLVKNYNEFSLYPDMEE